MKRFCMAAVCLLMVAALLSGCSSQQSAGQVYDEATQYIGPAITPTAEPVYVAATDDTSLFANNPYDVVPSSDYTSDDAMASR